MRGPAMTRTPEIVYAELDADQRRVYDAIVAGPLVRLMPSSWLWPERMAARSLRMPMWEGGQRMMGSVPAEGEMTP